MNTLRARYETVRAATERLAEYLAPEDQVVQSMPDTSPAKWHRAHTTWFFETFIVKATVPSYEELDPLYAFLFNSYYVAAGPRHTRAERGMISRPTVAEVADYRAHVDQAMTSLLDSHADDLPHEVAELMVLGLNHEQQHQELLLMDIKHLFWQNPFLPAYDPQAHQPAPLAPPVAWKQFEGGIASIGHDGDGFSCDNELPLHEALLQPFEIADRLVTCGEWLDFMRDDGYATASHWLSDGFHTVTSKGWEAPEYWFEHDGDWHVHTLHGPRPVDPNEPVSHLSYYEADAFASWAGARLPTEFEWEHASGQVPVTARAEPPYHPTAIAEQTPTGGLRQMYGEVWQWTSSPYTAYPGFRAAPGTVGEYNGKFMVNTWVLRGGSCATPRGHIRPTYRNFFHPATRWHFSGLRLARDLT